ncbi:MAG TPA: hypothetical protein DCL61_29810 [Cyanobacteria bacterium UBA12227]|nr:hypothetical protein [Cyanobacteria bacterium UBA12227]HAX88912.1 hypothetical protein [Cyanobacteria bacterium UBA11370]HBY80118.1 hypothetical protein [Cyanobacteria bacterium UBA11148]
MDRMIAWFKRIRLDKVLTVLIAGILLFVSTACGGKVLAKTADQIRQEVPESALTSPYEGGMNDYSDVDPRQDTKQTKAKAKGLIDRVESNLSKRAETPEELRQNYQEGAPLGKRVQRLADNVRDAAENRVENVSKGTQRGVENIKENSGNAAEDVAGFTQRSAENAKQNTERAGRDLAKAAGRSVETVKQNTQRVAEDTFDAID